MAVSVAEVQPPPLSPQPLPPPLPSPLPPPAVKVPAPSGSGYGKLPSGSGLPEFPLLQWEWKADGAVEAWHTPTPKAPRRERKYLKRVGKRLLAEWLALPPRERLEVVSAWVAERRKEKGVEI